MVDYLPRTAWTAVSAAGSAMPAKPAGIVVHWPGEKRPIGTSLSVVRAKLEGYRRFHKNTHGWADIAYQVAFDQSGRVWDLRGIGRMSAANGNRDLNERYLAALFMVGEGEHPTPELLEAWRHWRSTVALRKHPTATVVKGHRQVRPGGTTCPGHIVQALITSGALTKVAAAAPIPVEDDMPLTAADHKAIAQEVWGFALQDRAPGAPEGSRRGAGWLMEEMRRHTAITVASSPEVMEALETVIEKVAADRGDSDPKAFAAAVAADLRNRLES